MSDVTVSFGAKDEGLEAAFGRIKQQAAGFAAGFGAVLASVAAVTAAFSALKGVVDGIKSFANFGGEISDLQAKTGLATGDLLILRQAFENAGMGSDKMAAATRKLQQNLVNASEGSGTAQQAFQKLGLNFNDLLKLPVDQQMQAVGKAIMGLEGDAQKTAAAMDIFGKSGADLLVLFKDTGAFDTARTQIGGLAENLGVSVNALDKLSDAITAAEKNKGFQFLAGFAKGFAGDIETAANKLNSLDLSRFGQSVGEVAKGAQVAAEKIGVIPASLAEAAGASKETTDNIANASLTMAAFGIPGMLAAKILQKMGQDANAVTEATRAHVEAQTQASLEYEKSQDAAQVLRDRIAENAALAGKTSELWEEGAKKIENSVSLAGDFSAQLQPALTQTEQIGQYFFDASTNVDGLGKELEATLELSKQQAEIAKNEADARDRATNAVTLLKKKISEKKEELQTAQTQQAAAQEQLSTIAGSAASPREQAARDRAFRDSLKGGGIGERFSRQRAARTADYLSQKAKEEAAFGNKEKAAKLEEKASKARAKAFGKGEGDKTATLEQTVTNIETIIKKLEEKLPVNALTP